MKYTKLKSYLAFTLGNFIGAFSVHYLFDTYFISAVLGFIGVQILLSYIWYLRWYKSKYR